MSPCAAKPAESAPAGRGSTFATSQSPTGAPLQATGGDPQLAVAVRERDGHGRRGEGVLLDVRIVAAGRVPDGEVDADRRAVPGQVLELAAQGVRARREGLREGDGGAGGDARDRPAVDGRGEDVREILVRSDGQRAGRRNLRAVRRIRGGERRCGVVHPAVVDRGRDGHVARVVGHPDAQVVEAVGDARRVPRRGDVRPRARARRRALIGDRRDARARIARGRGQVDGALEIRAWVVHDRGRVRVVDQAVLDDRGGERVAHVVGDDDAQVVEVVRDPGGVPGRRVRGGRVGRDRAPRAGVGRGGLEDDLLDAHAGVARRSREVDRAAQRAARVGEAAARRGRVHRPGVDRGARIRVSGGVRRPHAEGVAAVGEAGVGRGARAGGERAAVEPALEGRAALGGREAEVGARSTARIRRAGRDRRVGRGRVDRPGVRLRSRLGIAGGVGRLDVEGVGAFGRGTSSSSGSSTPRTSLRRAGTGRRRRPRLR